MPIQFRFSQQDIDTITTNDSYGVFKNNLDTLERRLKENGCEGDFFISIKKYRKGYPLDFNWMQVTIQNGDVYEVLFQSFKIKEAKKR